MNYYISDLHLFHQANIKYDGRPFQTVDEMNNTILRNWNATVNNGDTVYVLGDISLKSKSEDLIALVAKLKGRKVLIKGNHDDLSDLRYKQLFAEIHDYKFMRDYVDGKVYNLVLSHSPIMMWEGQHRGVIHLYGHVHNSQEHDFYQDCLSRFNSDGISHREGDKKAVAFNVGCMMEYMNYTPRTLKELLKLEEVL